MSKATAFLKNSLIYLAVNIVMAAFMAAVLLCEGGDPFNLVFTVIRNLLLYALIFGCWAIVPFMIYTSILAYRSVKKNDENGVAYSLLGGFIGGFAAVRKNKGFPKATAVNIIFIVYLWIFIGFPAGIGLMFAIGVYDMI